MFRIEAQYKYRQQEFRTVKFDILNLALYIQPICIYYMSVNISASEYVFYIYVGVHANVGRYVQIYIYRERDI